MRVNSRYSIRATLTVTLCLIGLAMSGTANAKLTYVNEWGVSGAGHGQFNYPCDLDVDARGYVYISDMGNHRIQKFDSSGNHIKSWGSWGSRIDQFESPCGISADGDGNLFIADSTNSRILASDTSGGNPRFWGTQGDANGLFDYPDGVAADRFGKVFVADTLNNRIQKFDSFGRYQKSWGTWGSERGQFASPHAIATDHGGAVYVADSGNRRIQVFNSEGQYRGSISEWGPVQNRQRLGSPTGVVVDDSGNVYVSDSSQRVIKFSNQGDFIEAVGSRLQPGNSRDLLDSPRGLALDSEGNLYVADSDNDRIVKYQQTEDRDPSFKPPAIEPVTNGGSDGSNAGKEKSAKLKILSIAISPKGKVKVRLECIGTQRCKGTIKLKSASKRGNCVNKQRRKKLRQCRGALLGKARFSVVPGSKGEAVFLLSNNKRRWIDSWARTHRKLKLTVEAKLKNSSARGTTVRKNFTMSKS